MIVVDTSVWIEADRRPAGPIGNALLSLGEADEIALPLPVRLELAAGAPRKSRKALLRRLAGLPIVVPTEDTWRLIESWIAPAADQGHRFTVGDLLIAGLAHEIGAVVWSLDVDFKRLEALGFVQRYDAV